MGLFICLLVWERGGGGGGGSGGVDGVVVIIMEVVMVVMNSNERERESCVCVCVCVCSLGWRQGSFSGRDGWCFIYRHLACAERGMKGGREKEREGGRTCACVGVEDAMAG